MASPELSGRGLVYISSASPSPDLLSTAGIKSAFHFKAADATAAHQYLVLYPVDDLSITQGEEFQGKDLGNSEVRYYQFHEKYDPEKGSKPKLLVAGGFDLGAAIEEQDFHDWYNKEHYANLATVPGYVRSTRIKWLKSSPEPEDKTKAPVTWLALHEFDREKVDTPAFIKTIDTDWSRRILGKAERSENPVFWTATEVKGEGAWF